MTSHRSYTQLRCCTRFPFVLIKMVDDTNTTLASESRPTSPTSFGNNDHADQDGVLPRQSSQPRGQIESPGGGNTSRPPLVRRPSHNSLTSGLSGSTLCNPIGSIDPQTGEDEPTAAGMYHTLLRQMAPWSSGDSLQARAATVTPPSSQSEERDSQLRGWQEGEEGEGEEGGGEEEERRPCIEGKARRVLGI